MKQSNTTQNVLHNALNGLQPERPEGMTQRFMTRIHAEERIDVNKKKGQRWRIAFVTYTVIAAAIGALFFFLPWQQGTDTLPIIEPHAKQIAIVTTTTPQTPPAEIRFAPQKDAVPTKSRGKKATKLLQEKSLAKVAPIEQIAEESIVASPQQPTPTLQNPQKTPNPPMPTENIAASSQQLVVSQAEHKANDAIIYTPEERRLIAYAEKQQYKAQIFTAEVTAMAKIRQTTVATATTPRREQLYIPI